MGNVKASVLLALMRCRRRITVNIVAVKITCQCNFTVTADSKTFCAWKKTFRNEFVQVLTRQAKSCNVDRIVSDAFLHLYAEVTLVLLEELLRTGIISREADELLAEYCSFVYSGWKGLAGQ